MKNKQPLYHHFLLFPPQENLKFISWVIMLLSENIRRRRPKSFSVVEKKYFFVGDYWEVLEMKKIKKLCVIGKIRLDYFDIQIVMWIVNG